MLLEDMENIYAIFTGSVIREGFGKVSTEMARSRGRKAPGWPDYPAMRLSERLQP
jgi:hypothetical protein